VALGLVSAIFCQDKCKIKVLKLAVFYQWRRLPAFWWFINSQINNQ